MNSLTITRFPALSYATEEAVNTLCTNLSFSGANVRKIMITSCHESEGKSFLTMNVMRTMSGLGKTVALVDADLRLSMITNRYGLRFDVYSAKKGLAHYLAGMADVEDVIYKTNIDNAYMVPIGRKVTNALPLLNSPRFGRLLDHLAKNVDYVIVDAPPVGTVIDGAQIAKSCDGTLIVVNYNTVRRQELIDVKRQLEQTGCPILGVALNMVEYNDYLSRKYYYKAYYSDYGRYGRYDRSAHSRQQAGQKEQRAQKAQKGQKAQKA